MKLSAWFLAALVASIAAPTAARRGGGGKQSTVYKIDNGQCGESKVAKMFVKYAVKMSRVVQGKCKDQGYTKHVGSKDTKSGNKWVKSVHVELYVKPGAQTGSSQGTHTVGKGATCAVDAVMTGVGTQCSAGLRCKKSSDCWAEEHGCMGTCVGAAQGSGSKYARTTVKCSTHQIITNSKECVAAAASLGLSYKSVAGSEWATGCLFHNGNVYFSPQEDGTSENPTDGYICSGASASCRDAPSTGFKVRGRKATCHDLRAYCTSPSHGAKIKQVCCATCAGDGH